MLDLLAVAGDRPMRPGTTMAAAVIHLNGEHHAGVQVLSTNGFADLNGPLNEID